MPIESMDPSKEGDHHATMIMTTPAAVEESNRRAILRLGNELAKERIHRQESDKKVEALMKEARQLYDSLAGAMAILQNTNLRLDETLTDAQRLLGTVKVKDATFVETLNGRENIGNVDSPEKPMRSCFDDRKDETVDLDTRTKDSGNLTAKKHSIKHSEAKLVDTQKPKKMADD